MREAASRFDVALAAPAPAATSRRRFTNSYEVVGDEARLSIGSVANGDCVGVVRFNADDLPLIQRFYWGINPAGYAYAPARATEKHRRRCLQMHWLVAGIWHDHIDRDPLNNKRSNLRPASHAGNARNRGPQRNKRGSPLKGVTFCSRGRKHWVARIKVDGISKFLGVFADEESAGRAYDAAARECFGEFAGCNFN